MLEFNADSELFEYFHILHFNSFKLLIISLVNGKQYSRDIWSWRISTNHRQHIPNDWLHNSKEKSDEEESKHKDDQQNPLEKESETHQTWKMDSIKGITAK